MCAPLGRPDCLTCDLGVGVRELGQRLWVWLYDLISQMHLSL
jgi:hypothetical protein